ncbi:hypothetical protein [Microbacterium sp. PMB16]|uniref:hypothetical protein n=1 Tax=Microbacterium sp. PMB16 TaxID=3120157 RepID=UPI003F4C9BAF
MSAVSTANATVGSGIGALFGGAADVDALGSTTGKAQSSFGAALALAERMLDAGVDTTSASDESDASAVASNEVAVSSDVTVSSDVAFSNEGIDVGLPIDAAAEGQTVPDAGQPVMAIPLLATVSSAPSSEPLSTAPAHPAPGVAGRALAAAADALAGQTPDAAGAHVVAGLPGVSEAKTGAVAPATPAAVPAAAAAAAPVVMPSADSMPEQPAGVRPHAAVSSSLFAPESDAVPVVPAVTTAPKDGTARPDQPAAPLAPLSSSTAATTPGVTVSPTSTSVVAAPDASAAPTRAVAAQVTPVVLSIVQRPVGSHQLTMTVNPDTFGPVTVRAHIGAGGEVRVELLGATDAGREALRAIVTDLRRDLAAVMPHASLALGSSTTADPGSPDRGTQSGAGGAAGDQATGERERSHAPADPRPTSDDAIRAIPRILPITTRAVSGEGLDIFA